MGLVVATCDLEGTMLSEIVREGQIYDFTYMWNLKNIIEGIQDDARVGRHHTYLLPGPNWRPNYS